MSKSCSLPESCALRLDGAELEVNTKRHLLSLSFLPPSSLFSPYLWGIGLCTRFMCVRALRSLHQQRGLVVVVNEKTPV